jgi:hypothetical protein
MGPLSEADEFKLAIWTMLLIPKGLQRRCRRQSMLKTPVGRGGSSAGITILRR